MRIEFIGAAHEVTGSCHYLKIGEKHILVDCGMEQGADIYENQDIPVNAAAIDYVFVTHAHIDHSGLLPLLYARGFRGQIFATNATTQLCNIMLKDSAHIQEFEADWRNRKARRAGQPEVVPMYSMNDAQGVLNYFVPCDYDKKVHVCDELTVCFRDAGHLLGSSFIEMWAKEEEDECKLIFSGDIGNGNRALIRDPEIPESADYLIMESTYGDRNHEVPPDYASELARVLAVTFARGGNVVIPAFSVGRTQEMLYYLRKIKQNQMLSSFQNFEVYVDSPLAIEATNIFNKNVLECFREKDLEMIKNGTTAFADSGGVHMEHVADAVIESGMRAAIAKSTMDMGNAITGAMKETASEAIDHTKELYKNYQGAGDGRVDIWFAIRQVMTCSRDLITMVGECAKELHTGIHAHLCEHKDEVSFCLQNYQKRPAEFLDEMGILGPNLLTAHNVMLSDHDITLMAERGVKMIHCPRANLANHGFPKAPQILEAGASVGLGCDGAAPSNLDIFDEMKVLRYAMLAYWGLPSFNPVVMTCPTLLKMASQGGANAIGHGDILGSVKEGKKADLILLNIDQPHITPTQNLVNTIVDAANGHDVIDSIINGKLVMKNREVLTLDEERIRFEATQHMNEIIKRAY